MEIWFGKFNAQCTIEIDADNFWGICKCGRCTGGYNMLGNILQEVREHFNSIV